MFEKRVLVAIVSGALCVMVSAGIRQSLGLFLQPVSDDLGVGREIYSLAIAIQNIVVGFPLVGFLADRAGARWTVVGGGILYGGSLVLVALIARPLGLFVTLGLLAGIALSATSYVVVLGAVAQVAPIQKRSTAFGMITAFGSFGMFIVVPGAQWLLIRYGWRDTFLLLSTLGFLFVGLAFGLPRRPVNRPEDTPASGEGMPLPSVLRKAFSHSGYLLLVIGFFVCGFHVAFIATHLPAYLTDNGVPMMVAATALALIGFFNIIGSYTFGMLGDRYRKKFLLSLLYFARAIVISLFLLVPVSSASALLFTSAIGFLWLATVPLTSGTVAQIFGSRYLSSLYGIVFFSHQIGAFLAVWLGGRIYDASSSYMLVWMAAVGLSSLCGCGAFADFRCADSVR